MFQGHVAKITRAIGDDEEGRVAFDFDGQRYEFRARWTPAAELPESHEAMAAVGADVVIETVDGDLAFVEPWVRAVGARRGAAVVRFTGGVPGRSGR
jgi:hypothetical protein